MKPEPFAAPEFDAGRPPLSRALAGAAIVTVCLLAGLPTILSAGYFLGDDFGLVHHLHSLPFLRLFPYFVSDWTEGIYGFTLDELRPLLAFSYWFDSRVFGAANAPGYHITNVALHVLNSLLVFGIARSITPPRTDLALLAGCLFAVMPSHAEPLAWISGRVDSLAGVFYLGAFLSFLRFRSRQSSLRLTGALILFTLGLFAKQSIVTFPVLILAYDVIHPPGPRGEARSQRISRYLVHVPFVVILILYLGLRRALFGNVVRESVLTVEGLRSFVARQSFYISHLLPIPPGLPRDGRTAVMVLTGGILAACALSLRTLWRHDRETVRRLIFFGAAWYAITIAPMIVTYESARHLYLTVAGVSIALASLLLPAGWRSSPWKKNARRIAVGMFVLLYAVSLTSNVRGWIANGVDSRRYAASLPGLLRSLPPGSTVMLDIPPARRGILFWPYALPFGLQPPFVAEDLYGRLAIVEWPIVYCCLPHQWWAAKQAALSPIFQSAGTPELTYIVPDPRDAGSLIVKKRTVSGAALRTKIEAALGRPVDALATGITQDEAQRVAELLFE